VGELLFPEKNPVKPLMAKWMKSEKETDVNVPVSSTGYYCVRVLNPSKSLVNISVDFQNPFGELPSEYRPLMMVYHSSRSLLMLRVDVSGIGIDLPGMPSGLVYASCQASKGYSRPSKVHCVCAGSELCRDGHLLRLLPELQF
jgi:hypothetical protein